MSEDRTEQIASAIEDLLYMGVVRLDDEKAILSTQFSITASNLMDTMKLTGDREGVMKLMYYSLLIYMNEHLKVPKSLTVALGNDMEHNRQNMESGELITTYVAILSEVWSQKKVGV